MKGSTEICPRFEVAAELLGKRWTGLILRVLLDGPKRFCELSGTLENLSERMLSERLKELEANGIVQRRVQPTTPVQVDYRLTEKGQSLKGVVDAMGKWAEAWVNPEDCAVAEEPARRARQAK
ncbi:MAG: helix-turn-helix domain-containing protein [Myxococcaceae bacterium]